MASPESPRPTTHSADARFTSRYMYVFFLMASHVFLLRCRSTLTHSRSVLFYFMFDSYFPYFSCFFLLPCIYMWRTCDDMSNSVQTRRAVRKPSPLTSTCVSPLWACTRHVRKKPLGKVVCPFLSRKLPSAKALRAGTAPGNPVFCSPSISLSSWLMPLAAGARLRQYLYFCTSKASKLSTCGGVKV